MSKTTLPEIQKFITDYLVPESPFEPTSKLDLKANIISAGFIDSFGFLDMVSEIEKKFSIEVDLSDQKPETFLTVEGLSKIIFDILARRR